MINGCFGHAISDILPNCSIEQLRILWQYANLAAKAAQIEAGIARLIAPGGMGTRFQVIGVRSPSLPPSPALQAMDRGGDAS